MKRFFLLLVVALLGASACWLFCQGNQPVSPDDGMGRSEHGAAPAPAPDGIGVDDAVVGAAATNPGRRVAAGGPAASEPDPVTTTLRVRVVSGDDEAAVADYSVSVVDTDADDPFFARAVTNARGQATFAIPVVRPRHLIAFLSGGNETWLDLPPGEAREVMLQLEPRIHVEGSVVDAAGRGVADAELLYLPNVIRKVVELPRVTTIGRTRADGSFRVILPGGGHLGARHSNFAPSPMQLVADHEASGAPTTITMRLALLARPGLAAGRVVDADDAPVAAAIVEFRTLEGDNFASSLPAPPIRLRTDANGRFATADLRPGSVRYEALAAGVGCARGVFPANEIASAELRIQLQGPASVRGTVTDAEGGALPRVVVQSGRPGDLLARRTSCAADGSYSLDGLPAGPAELIAREEWPSNANGARRRVSITVDLIADSTFHWSPQFHSLKDSQLEGIVLGGHNSGLAGWTVLAQQTGNRAHRVTTDTEGRFSLPIVGDGSFEVHAYAPGQSTSSFAAAIARNVDPHGGMLILEVDLTTPPAVVTGHIESTSHEQLAAAISCWHVALQQTVKTVAGLDGSFRFDGVPAGAIVLFLSHPGYLETTQNGEVQPGSRLDLGVITMAYGSAVHGRVSGNELSGNDPTGQGGLLPEQLAISIQTAGQRFTAEFSAGSYRFEAIPPGSHRLLVQGPGIAAASLPIEVAAGVDLEQDIVVVRGLGRTIRVTTTADCSWITLALQQRGKPYTWIAGQPRGNGMVEFTAHMAAGSYEAIAWDDSGHEGSTMVTFATGSEPPVTVRLDPK
ncbi:MAG: carboxypeptidase regulatory-like domain-containing protein [Planctomycetes bacterium]|nr:carboxypeptidase regulatory-like domain-containing protein [Planctomycetota bacterium]